MIVRIIVAFDTEGVSPLNVAADPIGVSVRPTQRAPIKRLIGCTFMRWLKRVPGSHLFD